MLTKQGRSNRPRSDSRGVVLVWAGATDSPRTARATGLVSGVSAVAGQTLDTLAAGAGKALEGLADGFAGLLGGGADAGAGTRAGGSGRLAAPGRTAQARPRAVNLENG